MTNDLNDSLDALFAGDTGPVRTTAQIDRPAAREHIERTTAPGFVQQCSRCRGTGQTPWGVCFKCKGAKSKTFKTSPEARAQASVKRAERKARTEQESLEAFEAAHPVIWAWIKGNQSFDFARKMVEAIVRFGSLTEGQLAACQRCADREAAKVAERAKAAHRAPQVDVARIEQAFASARASAARPGQQGVWVKPLRLRSEAGIDVTFKDGTPGTQWEGMLFIKNANGDKLGFIKEGRFQKRFGCTEAEAAAVVECAGDPSKAATAFGKAWSRCSVCFRTLTNDESIGRAMGPICAERFGF